MNKPRKPLRVSECKIQASILLKSLHANNMERATHAAKRFKRLKEFSELTQTEIIKTDIKRKHALAVIAIEKGFKSWHDLKAQLPFIIGGFLNKWFANYADAKLHLQTERGFLLPYKNQFFICDEHYIKQLGFDPHDSDWQLIGFDWEKPHDQKAKQRLYVKWMKIQGARNE